MLHTVPTRLFLFVSSEPKVAVQCVGRLATQRKLGVCMYLYLYACLYTHTRMLHTVPTRLFLFVSSEPKVAVQCVGRLATQRKLGAARRGACTLQTG